MLRTEGLTKEYGGLTAVDDVDFELEAGELCSLIGPNGAGKTTFFDLLTGRTAPTAGEIALKTAAGWTDITDDPPARTAARGVHRSFQITNVFPQTSVHENVRVAAQSAGPNNWRGWRNSRTFRDHVDEADAILDRVGLSAEAETIAGTLAHGQLRQLEVGIALAGDPDVLLLDEPTAGVSSDGIDVIMELIEDISTDHAVLLVEHNMDVVMHVSDRIVVLNQGAIIADGPPDAIRGDERVQEAYLGGYDADETSLGAD